MLKTPAQLGLLVGDPDQQIDGSLSASASTGTKNDKTYMAHLDMEMTQGLVNYLLQGGNRSYQHQVPWYPGARVVPFVWPCQVQMLDCCWRLDASARPNC